METMLHDAEQLRMRGEGTISENEVAIMVGDLLVAENVVSRERRMIGRPVKAVQEGRRILKD
jgi:hypothetical protein